MNALAKNSENVELSSTQKAPLKLAVLVPLFLSAAFYLSVLFAFCAALPIFYAHRRYGRWFALFCCLTNFGIVFFASGPVNASGFLVLGIILGFILSESVERKIRPEKMMVSAVVGLWAVSGCLLMGYAYRYDVNPIDKLDQFIGRVVEQVGKSVEKNKLSSSSVSSQELEKFIIDPEVTKKNILYEMPSAITIFFLCLAVLNFFIAVQMNLAQVRKDYGLPADYFLEWKAPELLVWPSIVAGFFLVIELPVISEIALNVFKVLMAVYAFQGLAIIGCFFRRWNVRNALKPVLYFLSLVILLPMVISLGFFDLWFSFREKIRENA